MRKFRTIKFSSRETGFYLFYGIIFKKDGKWCGLAEGNKPLEFKTKREALEYGDKFFSSKNAITDMLAKPSLV